MNRKFLPLAVILICMCFAQAAYAQRGSLGVGIRAALDGPGLTVKYFLKPDLAFEGQMNAGGIAGLEGKSFNMVGLFEYHIVLPDPQWRLFFGGGIHFGVWDRGYRYSKREGRYITGSEGIFGIDGIGGIEYVFRKPPIGISFDVKPAINFLSDVDFFPHNMVAISGRYYFR